MRLQQLPEGLADCPSDAVVEGVESVCHRKPNGGDGRIHFSRLNFNLLFDGRETVEPIPDQSYQLFCVFEEG